MLEPTDEGLDVEHVAQQVSFDRSIEGQEVPIPTSGLVNRDDPVVLAGDPDQFVGLGHGQAHRLLDHHVFAGSKLPFAPDFKGSIYARYDAGAPFLVGDDSYFQVSFTHVDDSLNQVQETVGGNAPQIVMEAYQTMSAKFGVTGEGWELNLFIDNLTDERGQLYHDITDFETFWGRQRTAVIRPREFGSRFFREWQ